MGSCGNPDCNNYGDHVHGTTSGLWRGTVKSPECDHNAGFFDGECVVCMKAKLSAAELQIHDYRAVIAVALQDLKAAQELGTPSHRVKTSIASLEEILDTAGVREKKEGV